MLVSFIKDHNQSYLIDVSKSKIMAQFNKYFVQYNMNNGLMKLFDKLDLSRPLTLKYIQQGMNVVVTYVNN